MITRGGHVEKIKDFKIQLYAKFKMSNLRTMQQYIGLEFIYLSTRFFFVSKQICQQVVGKVWNGE
jgi:hypothetical protein